MKVIKKHQKLKELVQGKTVLHLNSLGKDSAVTLHWLATFARPKKIVSVHFKYMGGHPMDLAYLNYQRERYKHVEFIVEKNNFEASFVAQGTYQKPEDIFYCYNHFEYEQFDFKKIYNEIAEERNCDFICLGHSRYESFTRASMFHKKGILIGNEIYPIGMMSKKEVIGIIKAEKLMLHPFYKFSKSSLDTPSYYKMRSAFIASPDYKKAVMKVFPFLALDEYRYKKLLKIRKEKRK